jgi:Chromo (CHRromatin Organisation MOdifier) domain
MRKHQCGNASRRTRIADALAMHADASFRRLEWVPVGMLKEERTSLWRAYHQKVAKGTAPTQLNDAEDGVCPEWRLVERVVASKGGDGGPGTRYLVKWQALGHAECTWEKAKDLTEDQVRPLCVSTQCGPAVEREAAARSTHGHIAAHCCETDARVCRWGALSMQRGVTAAALNAGCTLRGRVLGARAAAGAGAACVPRDARVASGGRARPA